MEGLLRMPGVSEVERKSGWPSSGVGYQNWKKGNVCDSSSAPTPGLPGVAPLSGERTV